MTVKKILIIFSDFQLPYSPTTLNLFYSLKKLGFDVTLLAEEPVKHFSLQRVKDPKIRYVNSKISPKSFFRRMMRIITKVIGSENLKRKYSLFTAKALNFINAIADCDADIIIAVDFFSLWCVQQLQQPAHLLSLEILENDRYYSECDLSKIKSVIIQSEVRYNYLFKENVRPPFSVLPNSPFYDDFVPDYENRVKHNLIFCGSAIAEFGIFNCLDFLLDFPAYRLTIKGAVPENTRLGIEAFYSELLTEGRLVLNDTYMSSEELNRYVSTFWAGFAFYDFYRFHSLRKFNYYTAPSGKLYQYFNSGIPVIGNQLEGFNIVENKRAGKLIKHLSSIEIKRALDTIDASYYELASNAKKISLEFDLQKFMDNVITNITSIE